MVETSFHVRYAETDQMGIVHHAAYIVWLEEGRSAWLRAHGTSFVAFEQEGLSLAVSEVKLRYSQAARYDQRVTVRCWVEEVKSRRIVFRYEILDAENRGLFASGYTRHICIDRAGQAATIPPRWRTLLTSPA